MPLRLNLLKTVEIDGPVEGGKIEVFSAQADLIEAWKAFKAVDTSSDLPDLYVIIDDSFIYKCEIGQNFKKIEDAIQAIWKKDPDFKVIVDKINWANPDEDIDTQAGTDDELRKKLNQYLVYKTNVDTVRDLVNN